MKVETTAAGRLHITFENKAELVDVIDLYYVAMAAPEGAEGLFRILHTIAANNALVANVERILLALPTAEDKTEAFCGMNNIKRDYGDIYSMPGVCFAMAAA